MGIEIIARQKTICIHPSEYSRPPGAYYMKMDMIIWDLKLLGVSKKFVLQFLIKGLGICKVL